MINRYSPVFIALHWLLAGVILMQLSIGSLIPLSLHVLSGVLIGLLMIIRLVIRFQSSTQSLKTEKTVVHKLAVIAHYVIYGLVFAVICSGAGLLVIRNSADENILSMHDGLIDALFFMVGLHVIAVLFHQFVLKDRLLSKMWFRKTIEREHLSSGKKLNATLPNR